MEFEKYFDVEDKGRKVEYNGCLTLEVFREHLSLIVSQGWETCEVTITDEQVASLISQLQAYLESKNAHVA